MLTADYIIGLTDGEGCFLVQIRTDYRIVLRYFITQRFDNKELLDKVFEFFKIGYVYRKFQGNDKKKTTFVYEVTKQDDIQNVIIPFFKEYPLEGVKQRSFERFARIAEIVKNRQDIRKLTKEELETVWQLKLTMNTLHNKLRNISARLVPEIGSLSGNGKQP
ncbi:LAGLIDADG family homing endonuclease [Patescibacteria group bacterium]|nr:LAGLIDADG family homing endonuclease [Patescibacteria group bacterium]